MNRRHFTPLFLSVLLLYSCDKGADSETSASTAKKPLEVEGVVLKTSSFNNEMLLTANLLPNEQVELKAPVSGTVLDIYFDEGEQVKKGEAIIRIDDRSWRAQLAGLQSQLRTAQKNYDRRKSLLEIEGSSQEEVDEAETSIQSLEAQIQELQVNVTLANVKAPFSGQLGMRDFSLGAFLQSGSAITTLTATDKIKVEFDLPQENVGTTKVGDKIKVVVQKDTVDAEIYALNPVINRSSRSITIRAIINKANKLKIVPGAYAQVILPIEFVENALLVPTQAVVPEVNVQTVYLYKSGRAIRTEVELGTRTKKNVLITEGLQPGDSVITTGLLQVRDSMDVSFTLAQ